MANEIEKVNSIDIADIEKIMGRDDDDTDKLGGLEFEGVFVDPYTGNRLVSQGTGARYSIWGCAWVGSYGTANTWVGFDNSAGDQYTKNITQKSPFTGADASHTGDMEWGKQDCGVACNGTTMISSGGYGGPTEPDMIAEMPHYDWEGTMGPYVVGSIEYITSSSGGNADEWGQVHHWDVGYPGYPSGHFMTTARFYYGSNAVGEDGSTGYYAGGSGRWSPARVSTNEIWKTSISSASNSVDWGSNLASAATDGMTGMSGITSGGAETRWIIMGSNIHTDNTTYFTFASSSSGSAHGDLLENQGYSGYTGDFRATGSNGTTGLIMGGSNQEDSNPDWQGFPGNTIQYLSFSSTNHAAMWGDTSLISYGYTGRSCNGQYLEAYTAILYKDRPDDDEQAVTPRTGQADRVSLVSAGNASVNGSQLGIAYNHQNTCHNGGTGSN